MKKEILITKEMLLVWNVRNAKEKNIAKMFVKGHQRYKFKNCGYQFVPTLQKGFDEQTKLTACLLYISGLSLRTIARLLHTSATSVLS